MMRYNEILNAITEIRRDINGMKTALDTEIDNYYKQFDGMTLKEKIEAKKSNKESEEKHLARVKELQDSLIDAKLRLKLMENNAKIALFNESIPYIVEVWNKYKNKPLGEKTRDKIRAEIKEKHGVVFYISNRYGNNDFHLTDLKNGYELIFGTRYIDGNKKEVLIDNKAQELFIDDLQLFYIKREYIEDLDGTIEELKRLRREAEETQKKLQDICSSFNDLAVDGIPTIIHSENIYGAII